VRGPQQRGRARHQPACRGRERAEPHHAADGLLAPGQIGFGLLQLGENQLRVLDQPAARIGEPDPPTGPFQQPHPGLPLQDGELLGDRGRREVQRLRRRREGAPGGDLAKQPQPAYLQHVVELTSLVRNRHWT